MKLITSEKEYDKAHDRLDELFDSNPKTKEGQEAEVLALLIETYEQEHYPIDTPDPITAIRIRMEELELKQKDLVGIIGSKGIVSEKLKIAAQILIQEYEL